MSERRADFELLRDFVRHGDQQAFALLVRRHIDLVYGTAFRKVTDQGGAEEITQNVFAALSRKAWQFDADDSLAAWLHRAALLEAKEWLRGELRRRRREQTAAELGTTMNSEEQPAPLVPLLDEALLSLRERDREALLLRFYNAQSLREVGAALGVGEDAAQKRVAGALGKLVAFFQRRGFKTVTSGVAATALQQAATSAPAAVAASMVQAAHWNPSVMFGLAGVLSRFAALKKLEVAILCAVIVAVPVVWQWNTARAAAREVTLIQAELESVRVREAEVSDEIERGRAGLDRLNAGRAAANTVNAIDDAVALDNNALTARLRGLLSDPNYRWPDDSSYVRIPKSVVKSIPLQGQFGWSGALSEAVLELYAITREEKMAAEQALGNYWSGVQSLMAARAAETNAVETKPGRLTKTVIVPPLGQDVKTLAGETSAALTEGLGEERASLIFGRWKEGGIQIFWPGNVWNISKEPQEFTAWVERENQVQDGRLKYGASWKSTLGGTSSEGDSSLHAFPRTIATQFFTPWLAQFGVTNSYSRP